MTEVVKIYFSERSLQFTVGVGILVAGIATYAYHRRCTFMKQRELQINTEKRQERRAKEFENLKYKYPLTAERNKIIELPYDELINKLHARQLTAVEVLVSYVAKALQVTSEFNCVTEFYPHAFELAETLDKGNRIKGPLHGLPICIKEDTDLVGMDTTLGCAKNLNKPKSNSAPFIQVMIELGAIPFCKTNVPQTLCSFESHNPIFGETLNPLDKSLSPGGSSSGTGCLIGGGGALIGTGSDIGGSLRVPAHFNGISTIKPTYRRHSSKGISEMLFPGIVGIKCVPGILAKTSKIVANIFKCITEGNPQYKYDCNVVPIPWNNLVFESKSKLRIGYYTSLPCFAPMGDTEEIVLNAKDMLEANGHYLVPFELPGDCVEWLTLISDFTLADGGSNFAELLANEEISFSIESWYKIFSKPILLRFALALLYKFVPGKHALHHREELLQGLTTLTYGKLWNSMEKRRTIIEELQKCMDNSKLDLILCPAYPFPAPKLRDSANLLYADAYTIFYNFVDFPAGVISFGIESGKNISSYDCDNDPMLELAKASIQESTGMPIGVQIVGKPFQEELVLRLMVELEELRLQPGTS